AGSADMTAPISTNAKRLTSILPGASLYEIDGAGHYVFLNTCNKRGRKFVPVCKDPDSIDRAQVHALVVRRAVEFFDTNF
ncbi:MAG: hypothetical protein L3J05_04315, partial [Robiginitomaculum sp.]|nr:hypothetical protein [Robiginitomaculum sp.]